MGVDLEGSRARAARKREEAQAAGSNPDLIDFSRMTGDEVRAYWDSVRRARMGRLEGRQDNEIVGIAGGYLAFTAVVLLVAVLFGNLA
jgi:hypothetical protein